MKVLASRVLLMLIGVLPLICILAALMLITYPGETASFAEMLANSVVLVYAGPSVLGLLLVFLHPYGIALLRKKIDRGITASSILAGIALGIAMGGIWAVVSFWDLSAIFLGTVAGALYGGAAAIIGGGRLLQVHPSVDGTG